ncbi:hypothetical protein TSOC_013832, partial [Tetrabaena socialis]
PPQSPESLRQGLWFYQMQVLKPWFPAFDWGTVGLLYLASCTASGAQELLVRGWGGTLLVGWYGGLLAGATDAGNPLYWVKVFQLATPDTTRWLAAASLIALQVSLSSASASRARAFTRTALNRLSVAAEAPGGAAGAGLQRTQLVEFNVALDKPKVEFFLLFELPTAEQRMVYWSSMAVSLLQCGATNCAWAASGNLLGSFTAQVVIDGLAAALQQAKATTLPERELWEEVQRLQEAEEEKGGKVNGKEEEGKEGTAK